MAESSVSSQVEGRKSNRSWWWTRAEVELGFLPATVDLSFKAIIQCSGLWTLALLGMVMSMALFNVEFGDWTEIAYRLLLASGSVAAILGGLFTFFAYWQRRKMTFDGLGVTVEGNWFLGRRKWSLPYSAFEGVLYREAHAANGMGGGTIQIIELRHEDPGKTVPLLVEESNEAPRERWKNYARRLKLPALEQAGEEIVARSLGDLDKSIGDRVRAGAPSTAFLAGDEPPKGLISERAEIMGEAAKRIRLSVIRPTGTLLIGVVGADAILAGGAAVALAVMDFEFWWIFALLAVANVVGIIPLYFVFGRQRREVLVSRTRILVEDIAMPRNQGPRTFRISEIEDIRIKPGKAGFGKVLSIAGKREQAEIGWGLSDQALAWLRDYLIAAAARA